MQTRQILIIAGLCFCAALLIAQTLPSAVPLATREHQFAARHELLGISWQFQLKGKKYAAKLTREQITSGPEWSPSSSLPVTLPKAEQIARAQLRKIVGDDSTWDLTELSLQRLRDETEPKWYYLIKLMPKERASNVISDSFCFPISFSGEPGQINVNGQ